MVGVVGSSPIVPTKMLKSTRMGAFFMPRFDARSAGALQVLSGGRAHHFPIGKYGIPAQEGARHAGGHFQAFKRRIALL